MRLSLSEQTCITYLKACGSECRLWLRTEVISIWNDFRSAPQSGLRLADDQRVYEFTALGGAIAPTRRGTVET